MKSKRRTWGGRAGAKLFQFWLNDDERQALDRVAEAHDRPRSEILRKLVAQEDARIDSLEEIGRPL